VLGLFIGSYPLFVAVLLFCCFIVSYLFLLRSAFMEYVIGRSLHARDEVGLSQAVVVVPD
jgi:hypothetical protein